MSGIQIKLAKETIYYPGDSNHSSKFEVFATNISHDWVMMQVKVYGASHAESQDWYSVQPLVTAKEPPGSQTRFNIEIIEPPILGLEGNIPLVIEVFSVENKNIFAKEKIGLKVSQPKSPVEFLFDDCLIVYPGQENKVPIRVRNRSAKPIDVNLDCQNKPLYWNIHWQNKKIKLSAKEERPEPLWVEVPEASKTDSGSSYQCQIEAKPKIGEPIPKKCHFVVVCEGTIELSCQDKSKKISQKSRIETKTNNQSPIKETVYIFEYKLKLTNKTNSKQEIELVLEKIVLDKNNKIKNGIEIEFYPQFIEIDRGQSKDVKASVKVDSAQLKKLRFQAVDLEISPQLKQYQRQSPPPNITFKPNPIVLSLYPDSKWWLFLLLFLSLLAALPIYQLLFPKTHKNTVNSVSFINNGLEVLSGSRDREVFQWHVNSAPERLFNPNALGYQRQVASKEQTQSEVRVIRARAKSGTEEVVVAAGLENDNIKLWTLAGGENTLLWSIENENEEKDSVFDLQFLQDGRYLFSAHGSGVVRQWNLNRTQGENTQPQKQIYLNGIPIYSLGVTKSNAGKSLVVAGGRFNTLAFWDWENDRVYILDPKSIQTVQKTENQSGFLPSYNRQHITSIAADEHRLVTADTQGYINVWDMEVLRRCMNVLPSWNKQTTFSCNDAALQWQSSEPGPPVRSVAMASPSQNDRCFYLASTGDDGKVTLRAFSNIADPPKQHTIAHFANTHLNTVDLTLNPNKNQALIASDGKNDRVRLYYHPIQSHADCQ